MNYYQLDAGNALDKKIKAIEFELRSIEFMCKETEFWLSAGTSGAIRISPEIALQALMSAQSDMENEIKKSQEDFKSL
jgi:hypothetical protein